MLGIIGVLVLDVDPQPVKVTFPVGVFDGALGRLIGCTTLPNFNGFASFSNAIS